MRKNRDSGIYICRRVSLKWGRKSLMAGGILTCGIGGGRFDPRSIFKKLASYFRFFAHSKQTYLAKQPPHVIGFYPKIQCFPIEDCLTRYTIAPFRSSIGN